MTEPHSWAEGMDDGDVDEIQYIIDEFARQDPPVQVGVGQNEDGSIYLYVEGEILVSSEYLERVEAILRQAGAKGVRGQQPGGQSPARSTARPEPAAEGGRVPPVEGVVAGVVLLQLEEFGVTVSTALELIDDQLGAGIATPNHIMTVAPEASPCPATEPQEVYKITGPYPYPPVCEQNSGANVRIYIADTGLLPDTSSFSWLEHNIDGQADPNAPAGPGSPIKPYGGHGTFVAGVARCMAPQADIFVANVFKVAGSAPESDLVKRLVKALGRPGGVDVFHVSAAVRTRKDIHPIAFGRWLNLLQNYQGIACVVAAGNNNSHSPYWPGAFPQVVSVGALGIDWHSRAHFSNYGGWVDVYAPGCNLVNAYADGHYDCKISPYKGTTRRFFGLAQWSGTSFSSPVVTGLIAARMTRASENSRQAARSLLGLAQSQAITGVGPILLPCCGADHAGTCRTAECCCGHLPDGRQVCGCGPACEAGAHGVTGSHSSCSRA